MERWTREQLERQFPPLQLARSWTGAGRYARGLADRPTLTHMTAAWSTGAQGEPIMLVFPRDLPNYLAHQSMQILMGQLLPWRRRLC